MSINLRLLKHFQAVCRYRSFSKAADELGLTHSAITKSVKKLESDWNIKLLDRTTKHVAPTEAGRRLYVKAEDLLGFAENVKAETIQGEREIRLVCGPAVIDTVIQPALVLFRKTFPNTRVTVQTMPPALAVEELVQRRIHLLVFHDRTIEGLVHQNRLKVKLVYEEPYKIIIRAGHPVLKTARTLEDMLEFDWVVAGFDTAFESSLSKDQQTVLAERNFPKYKLLSQTACIEMVLDSDMITTAPESAVAHNIESGALCAIDHPMTMGFSISAAMLADTSSEPTLIHFIECMTR
jgi:LysR family transcriptional regulator of abg operon